MFRHITPAIALLAATVLALGAGVPESPYRPGPGKYPRFESKQAEPGLTVGQAPDLPLPRTILYSVGPDELLADAEAWSKLGFGGFFLTGVAPEWSTDIWAADGEPWTIGRSDKTLEKVKQATEKCRALGCDVFLTMAFSHTFDWFDDVAWQKIENNFRQFAIFGRESGCTGLAIDIEYVWPQYHYVWEGYTYDGYTRADLVKRIQARATQIAKALYDEFPEAPLLTFPESGFNLGGWIQTAWIEEAARRNAPGGVHLCTEYSYRRPNPRYMLGHAWLNNRIMQSMLSDKGKAYWQGKCTIAEGLWPFGVDPDDYHGAAPTVEEFRQAFAAALMAGTRYNWIYSHDARPAMLGREKTKYEIPEGMEAYLGVLRDRAVITNPEYVRAATDLRRMVLRDYAPDLGLTIVPTFAGPREEMEVGQMPAAVYQPSLQAKLQPALWDLAYRLLKGDTVDLDKELHTQTAWMVVGPFDNTDKRGYATAYPPEQAIDTGAAYPGVEGEVRWTERQAEPGRATVNLAKALQPTEQVCAYALCYAVTDQPREVHIRVGANDSWKLWVGGQSVFENPEEGRIILDRDIVPIMLPAGTTPILLKVCNNKKDWGFVFRLTDADGKPVEGVRLVTME